MAEFQEVAAQKKRMCKMYDNNGCNGCPLSKGDCGVLSVRFADVDIIQRVETTVMSWAAEHPEPVYPTWWGWLFSIGAVTRKVKPDVAAMLIDTGLLDTIPDDIAQKLGIEPEEG